MALFSLNILIKMQNIFNIIKSNQFLFLYIIKYILVVKYKKNFITIITILFWFIVLFKNINLFISKFRTKINLIIDL